MPACPQLWFKTICLAREHWWTSGLLRAQVVLVAMEAAHAPAALRVLAHSAENVAAAITAYLQRNAQHNPGMLCCMPRTEAHLLMRAWFSSLCIDPCENVSLLPNKMRDLPIRAVRTSSVVGYGRAYTNVFELYRRPCSGHLHCITLPGVPRFPGCRAAAARACHRQRIARPRTAVWQRHALVVSTGCSTHDTPPPPGAPCAYIAKHRAPEPDLYNWEGYAAVAQVTLCCELHCRKAAEAGGIFVGCCCLLAAAFRHRSAEVGRCADIYLLA